jgi:hypothetical protein
LAASGDVAPNGCRDLLEWESEHIMKKERHPQSRFDQALVLEAIRTGSPERRPRPGLSLDR